ncbi:hypothetical protein [Taibaiella chishuiensis]|uniref:Cytochrome B n=1 Tax=Taibaiella chishuiensis TaxID=1434707 RepID=A0A2P8D1M8_9BACT|nr:hypothetical protein [Taibaiella chishuiensis]PSK91117.1 hypothetical protein B0I18_106128 [Taibaiella chishuiensis]
MYQTFIFLHSFFRWFVVLSLLCALLRAMEGYRSGRSFSATDNAVRHWTATIAHIQLVLGIMVYIKSPVVHYFWRNFREAIGIWSITFFALFHFAAMLAAIVLVTIGSALAKRRPGDRAKFRTLFIWFGIALVLIILAIPWPFSPLAQRPYLR